MKLILNATRVPFQATGIFRYAKILIETLEEIGIQLYIMRSNKDLHANGVIKDIPRWLYLQRTSRLFPVYWYLYALFATPPKGIPLLSATQHLFPFRKGQIISLLDMRPYHAPDTILQKIYARFIFPRSISNIRAVITISEASKLEIAQLYSIEKDIIHVVYLYPDTSKAVAQTGVMRKPYLLMIGASFKHKNLHLALINHEVWSRKYKLVVVASDNAYTQEMLRLAKAFGISHAVEFKFRTSDQEKETLLREASALLYISSMEGFGIPPLEAMGFGTPCLLSSIPVLDELYHNAGIFFDPNMPNDWRDAISQLEDPKRVGPLVREGYKRTAEFSPERTHTMLKSALLSILRPVDISESP